MHLKVSKSKSNGKTYQYAQLVESYRRKSDGKPTIRVKSSFGRVSDLEIVNLRAAVSASKDEKLVVVQELANKFPVVRRNLSYLDVAVVTETWEQSGLSDVIDEATKQVLVDVPVSKVVAALVAHRCLAGQSKLHAETWFPTTALDALLDLPQEKFNNSRIHRTMSILDSLETSLQRALAAHAREIRGGHFVMLFVDSTDTWFVGNGPKMAHLGLIKEGLFKDKVGIALICDDQGFPVHWRTYAGDISETKPMMDLVQEASANAWGRGVPIVADRALGSAALVATMLDKGVPFVTATRRSEFAAYSSRSNFVIPTLPIDTPVAEVTRMLQEKAGFTSLSDGSLFLDTGLIERPRTTEYGVINEGELCHSAHIMRLALQIEELLTGDTAQSTYKVAESLDCSHNYIMKLKRLTKLPGYMRSGIVEGCTPMATTRQLLGLLSQEGSAQHHAYLQLISAQGKPKRPDPRRIPLQGDIVYQPPDIAVKGALAFNPDIFESRRDTAQKNINEILLEVENINQRLLTRDRSDESLLSEIGASLKRRSMLTLFDIDIVRPVEEPASLSLKLKPDEWRKRRQHDGLFLVIANPIVNLNAQQLLKAYRAKNIVETDFKEIKSVLNLRPVRHRTDHKVRAHVTICVLALYIERLIEERLREEAQPQTATSALELLSTCHLNELSMKNSTSSRDCAFTVTQPDPAQNRILDALGLTHLVDNEHLLEWLTLH